MKHVVVIPRVTGLLKSTSSGFFALFVLGHIIGVELSERRRDNVAAGVREAKQNLFDNGCSRNGFDECLAQLYVVETLFTLVRCEHPKRRCGLELRTDVLVILVLVETAVDAAERLVIQIAIFEVFPHRRRFGNDAPEPFFEGDRSEVFVELLHSELAALLPVVEHHGTATNRFLDVCLTRVLPVGPFVLGDDGDEVRDCEVERPQRFGHLDSNRRLVDSFGAFEVLHLRRIQRYLVIDDVVVRKRDVLGGKVLAVVPRVVCADRVFHRGFIDPLPVLSKADLRVWFGLVVKLNQEVVHHVELIDVLALVVVTEHVHRRECFWPVALEGVLAAFHLQIYHRPVGVEPVCEVRLPVAHLVFVIDGCLRHLRNWHHRHVVHHLFLYFMG